MVLSGKAGSNGYYTSDVTLKAPSGYALSTTFGSGYVDSLEYNNVSSKPYLYFKQKSTGALSDKVSMPAIKIDKVIPVINGVKNGDKLYETSRAIEVTDANLESVTVNGSAIPVSAGKASTTLSLEGSKKDFTIVAKDQAGLTVTYNVTLMSDWMRSGVIPGAGKVTLYKGTGYKRKLSNFTKKFNPSNMLKLTPWTQSFNRGSKRTMIKIANIVKPDLGMYLGLPIAENIAAH